MSTLLEPYSCLPIRCATSVDRYWAIFDPLNYASRLTRRRSFFVIGAAWTAALLLSFPFMLATRLISARQQEHNRCTLFTADSRYAIALAVLVFLIPALIMSYAYMRIYRAATKQMKSRKIGTKRFKCTSERGLRPISLRIHVAQNRLRANRERVSPKAPSNADSSNSLKRQFNRFWTNSNKQIVKFTREHKAAKTLGIVFGVFLLCWTPFFIALHIVVYSEMDIRQPYLFLKLSNWLGWANSGMNPVIYIIWSRDFRRAFTRMFACCQKRVPQSVSPLRGPSVSTLPSNRTSSRTCDSFI